MYRPKRQYEVEFPNATRVEIADRDILEDFLQSWRFHDPSQLDYAGQTAEVESHSIDHGGDVIYRLKNIPGFWHQHLLSLGEGPAETIMGIPLIRRQEDIRDFLVRLALNWGVVAVIALVAFAEGRPESRMIAFLIGGFLGGILVTIADHRWELSSRASRVVFVVFFGGGGLLAAALWEALS